MTIERALIAGDPPARQVQAPRLRGPARAPLAVLLFGIAVLTTGCGLEGCIGIGDFEPTPEPEAEIRGRIADLPSDLVQRAQGTEFLVRAISVDGAVLAQTRVVPEAAFSLRLGPGVDAFNVRLVATAGSVSLKNFAVEASSRTSFVLTGDMGVQSTAAALVAERYAQRERADLASTPTGTLADVLANASGDDADVVTFRNLVETVLEATDPASTPVSTFDPVGFAVDDAALARASVTRSLWEAALEAAVDAALVPVVCDPSRIRTLFTVDMSGQGKDGNGAPQFIRQESKEGKVFLGITVDALSDVLDSAGTLRPRLTPNDTQTEMFDDGTRGDEAAQDQIFSATLDLPRGLRVLYKFTNGSPGEGFTGTEEWPGNARILEVEDVLTGIESGTPDCLVVRRDVFGDESSNKNFVNLNSRLAGGSLGYTDDLGGAIAIPPAADDLIRVGGLEVNAQRTASTLTPLGVPEARENGRCTTCPAPLTVSAEDASAPRLVAASFLATDETRVVFSEDLDVQTAGRASNFLLVNASNTAVRVVSAQVNGGSVVLTHEAVDPRRPHRLSVKDVTDASLAQNPIAAGSEIQVGEDQSPPSLVSARPASIVEVNPAARPAAPDTGEIFVLTFSETLDRVSAENADNYRVLASNANDDDLEVYAAFQRGRDVYVVTSQQTRSRPYRIRIGDVFDVSGNLLGSTTVDVRGLSLSKVTFRAVVDFAWTSLDGSERGLPVGEDLYLTGTVAREARGLDGRDLRVFGRTDVAGREGFRFEASDTAIDGAPVYELSIRLPAGTYAFKLAHGTEADAQNPPATLEGVTKALATRNDSAGVLVDPVTGIGRDGTNYNGARLSLEGQDLPGPGVVFKRENPDEVIVVGEVDLELQPRIVGTWRDVPFGAGRDYDDGLVDIGLSVAGEDDETPPRFIGVRARDSESVLVSFDEAIRVGGAGITAQVTGPDGATVPLVETLVGVPLSTQIVVRTGAMQLDTAYTLLISGVTDAVGNALLSPVTGGFTSPAAFSPFVPLVDDIAPSIASVRATSPTEVQVRFSERVLSASIVEENFTMGHAGVGDAVALVSVRSSQGGLVAVLTTSGQAREEPYTLQIESIVDVAGNEIDTVTVPFAGFGEFIAPEIEWAVAMTPTRVAVKWNESVTVSTATRTDSYVINGLSIIAVKFSADQTVQNAAFNSTWAPLRQDVVILSTSPMLDGGTYEVTAIGVQDLSLNDSSTTASFAGIAEAPTVDVLLTYLVSDTAGVVGVGSGGAPGVPGRAISPADVTAQREGMFIVGTALQESGAEPITDHAFTVALGGFPGDGEPLAGGEVQLVDDGTRGDEVAGDNVYSVRIDDVPLGSTVSYKAFASFTTTFAAENPQFPGAAFADAPEGPSVFGDGQEFPGNDNAVLLVADRDDDGVIRIENLFGDEITYKRKTGFPAFHFAVDQTRRQD